MLKVLVYLWGCLVLTPSGIVIVPLCFIPEDSRHNALLLYIVFNCLIFHDYSIMFFHPYINTDSVRWRLELVREIRSERD